MSDGLHKGLLNIHRMDGGEVTRTSLGAGTGRGIGHNDVPQVTEGGMKVGAGICVQ